MNPKTDSTVYVRALMKPLRRMGFPIISCVSLLLGACGGGVMPPAGNGNGNDNETPAARCATGAATDATTVSYADDVFPIFEGGGCLTSGCHGGGLVSFNYDLRTYPGVFGPGDNARPLGMCDVVPGDPDASLLIEKLESDNPSTGVTMPMNRPPLEPEQIELIRTWILEGAADN